MFQCRVSWNNLEKSIKDSDFIIMLKKYSEKKYAQTI